MLNLSDNELDRLSREAASQHDPGDLIGPRSWERLEVHLDKELGRASPDISRGLRGFRRLPFQFAPVILLIVGVSYYFVKAKGRKAESSGSPPLTVVKTPQQQPGTNFDSSLKNPSYSDKSTSTIYPDHSQHEDVAPGAAAPDASTGLHGASSGLPRPPGSEEVSSTPSSLNHASGSSTHDLANRLHPGTTRSRSGKPNHPGKDKAQYGGATTADDQTDQTAQSGQSDRTVQNGQMSRTGQNRQTGLTGQSNQSGQSGQGGRNGRGQNASTAAPEPSGPYRSLVQKPRILHSRPTISDSALRAYTAQTPANPGKKSGPSLHVNRSLTFGLQVAPDFTSVNALAGDRPGSSLGLTIDYQFLNGWHLGTGLLFSRKNYTARSTDYHVPYDYYMRNNIKQVDFVKGTMNMLEIPLTLRYDFSVTGNTIFFASGGVSTYLFGQEHCNYYFDFFGREACRDFHYSNLHNGIFSSANLSLGVETGISNSVSVQVAPYMKLPISDIGFGKLRMNSVGINFAVRYAPVLSRKRKH